MKNVKNFYRGFRQGMYDFGELIASLVNTVLLLLVYFLGVGLTWIFAKILGRNFLELQVEQGKKTYWTKLGIGKVEGKKLSDDLFRQF